MIYKVKANFIAEMMPFYYQKLIDGTINSLEPDGPEIVDSMQRARITAPGILQWSEHCYCPTPLMHEEKVVYRHFLTDIETESADEIVVFEGKPFMDYLASLADKNKVT